MATLYTALYIHLASRKVLEPPLVYLIVTLSLWAFSRLVWLLPLVYRNCTRGSLYHKATVMKLHDASHICIRLHRPLRVQAGQWVYLRVRGLSIPSIIESHPFMIAWSYNSSLNSDCVERNPVKYSDTLTLIVRRFTGITDKIHSKATEPIPQNMYVDNFTRDIGGCICSKMSKKCEVDVMIEGPFGRPLRLERFSSVVLFAQDHGIAAQLPYLRDCLTRKSLWTTKTRRVVLYWEISSESKWTI